MIIKQTRSILLLIGTLCLLVSGQRASAMLSKQVFTPAAPLFTKNFSFNPLKNGKGKLFKKNKPVKPNLEKPSTGKMNDSKIENINNSAVDGKKLQAELAELKKNCEYYKTRANNNQYRTNNKKQYSWWQSARRWMFKKCLSTTALFSAICASVWYSHQPDGKEIYNKVVNDPRAIAIKNAYNNTVNNSLIEELKVSLKDAIAKHDLKKLEEIIKQHQKNASLYSYINTRELAIQALNLDDKGNDFAEGLKLLLDEKIVTPVTIYTKLDNCPMVGDKTRALFETCKRHYNLYFYVKTAAALNVLLEYEKQLVRDIQVFNANKQNTRKMAPLSPTEGLNELRSTATKKSLWIQGGKTYLETPLDIYTKSGNQELIKAATGANAQGSKEVYERACKYLKITAPEKYGLSEINKGAIASARPEDQVKLEEIVTEQVKKE